MAFFPRMQHALRVARSSWRLNLFAAMEYRAAFGLQVFGMALNDAAFVAVWILFFTVLGPVNGWDGWESVGLLGFATLTFGIAFGFFGGTPRICASVKDASFDGFLLTPQPVLWRVSTSQIDVAALGDALFGALLLGAYLLHIHPSMASIGIALSAICSGAVITVAMSIIAQSVAFHFLYAENIAMSLFKSFLSPSLYPSGLFPPVAKAFFTFVIPAAVVAGLPVEMVKNGSWQGAILLWGLAVVWLFAAVVLFTWSVKRYESGNALGLRGAS